MFRQLLNIELISVSIFQSFIIIILVFFNLDQGLTDMILESLELLLTLNLQYFQNFSISGCHQALVFHHVVLYYEVIMKQDQMDQN